MIVSDSSPLIYLSKIGRLNLLKRVYNKILIPKDVYEETVIEAKGKAGVSEIEDAIEKKWIKIKNIKTSFEYKDEGIQKADANVLSLAKKYEIPFITNDRALYNVAISHRIRVRWLTLILVEAKKEGIIDSNEAERILIELIDSGLRINSKIVSELLKLIKK